MDPTKLAEIAAKQDAKQQEIHMFKSAKQHNKEEEAAEVIQRNYRGYRERRQLQGFGLDASTRWLEAVKEAQYRNATRPTSRRKRSSVAPSSPDSPTRRQSDLARQNWKRIGNIARRAGGDDTSDTDGEEGMTEEQLEDYRRRKMEAKREREKAAKMMDLQYFLEMVDVKHRHGSHLRAYHNEWKKADTNENFFYWLDYGEGKNVDLPTVPRERLESEQVRYLSREERLQYLVTVDQEGRLCWAKNEERINTTVDWKDSINGIVPKDDQTTPSYRSPDASSYQKSISSDSSSSSDASNSTSSISEDEYYANHNLKQVKGLHKSKHVSAAAAFNHLMRRSPKPNTWIFVADTSFRLYVGIKQSGAFQHSSFLHGARISAAGLIRIKDGQLRRLAPLSGHYRPPASNFRAFVHSLRDAGVDMSRVSISRSYAILVGLEGYVCTRKKIKQGIQHVGEQKDRLVHPEVARRREEEKRDKSRSAEKEREVLAERAERGERAGHENSFRVRLMRMLGIRTERGSDVQEPSPSPPPLQREVVGDPRQDAESGISPEGKR